MSLNFSKRAMVCSVLVMSLFTLAGPAPEAEAVIYGGRAFGAFVNLPGLGVPPTTVSDTGQLPPEGGTRTSFLVNVMVTGPLGPVLTATTMGDTTQGGNFEATSVAETQGLEVLPDHPAHLLASLVRAESEAVCVGFSGRSLIADLKFAGLEVTVTGQPNQTVTVPGVATLIINEQIASQESRAASITVNALHLILQGGNDEVIVSSATSSVAECPGPVPAEVSTWGFVKARFQE